MKKKLNRKVLDMIVQEAEQHMVDMFMTGEISKLLAEDPELLEMSIPSILSDKEYFRERFDMIIGEA
jgi:hypothetical protein|tara:strand:+ start:1083 stop:1283 length:201 start_codon:yes stop_codon:yes gene_type:complete